MFFKSQHLHRRMNDQNHLLHRDHRIYIEAQCQSEALVVNDDKQNAGITFNEAKEVFDYKTRKASEDTKSRWNAAGTR